MEVGTLRNDPRFQALRSKGDGAPEAVAAYFGLCRQTYLFDRVDIWVEVSHDLVLHESQTEKSEKISYEEKSDQVPSPQKPGKEPSSFDFVALKNKTEPKRVIKWETAGQSF